MPVILVQWLTCNEIPLRVDGANIPSVVVDRGAELGETIGSYRLERVLGRGGMGKVYLAEHIRLSKRAAIKVLAPHLAADPVYRSRFLTEARLLSEVDAPGIVKVMDVLEQDEPARIAFVMEYIEGPTLRKVLEKDRLSPRQAGQIGLQLVAALEAIHANNVVHRDIKPGNVILESMLGDADSPAPLVKLVDFGIAKASDRPAPHKTATGLIIGTPAYMAPEQVTGEPSSWETDIYALAEVLFEMFAGKRVFPEDQRTAFRMKLGSEPPEIPALEFPRGTRVAAIIRRCLEPEPQKRPTHGEIADVLSSIDQRAIPLAFVDQEEEPTRFVGATRTFAAPELSPLLGGGVIPVAARPPLENRNDAGRLVEGPITSPQQLDASDLAPVRPPPRKLGLWITVAVALSVGAIAAKVLTGPSSPESDEKPELTATKTETTEAPKVAAVVEPPVAEVEEAPLPEGDTPTVEPSVLRSPLREEAVPATASQVEGLVQVQSTPDGAKVIDIASGDMIGRTPLQIRVLKPSQVRLVLPGYKSRTVKLRPGDDRRQVKLTQARKRTRTRRVNSSRSVPRRKKTKAADPEELLPW